MAFRWILAAASIALCSVAIAGCGGGSETSGVTKAEFIGEANAICAAQATEWRSKLESLQKTNEESPGGASGIAAVRKRSEAAFENDLLPALETALEKLEQLDVPESDAAQVEKMLQSLSKGTRELEKEGVEGLLNGGIFADFLKEAKTYGLDCTLA